MTSRDDAEISRPPEPPATPSATASNVPSPEIDSEQRLDAERELELDALAEQILKRRFVAPKTLVGLGVPQPAATAGANQKSAKSAPTEASKPRVSSDRPPAWSDLGATQKHAFSPLSARSERAGARDREATPEQAAERDATEWRAADREATPEQTAERDATEWRAADREATPEQTAERDATEWRAADREATQEQAAERDATEWRAADREATDEHVAEREAAPGHVAERGMTEEHVAQSFSTIAPPPPDNAAELEVSALPVTRRYEMAPRVEPDAARTRTPVPTSDAPWALQATPRKEPQLASRLVLIGLAFAASLAATLSLVNSLLPSRKGNLLVTASGPNQVRIDQAEVLLDGKPVCAQVPCRLEGLSSGTHFVSVWANGYERMAGQPIAVRGGVDSALQLTLARRNSAALRISTNVPGLSVRLDGEDRGPAPTTLHQLSPTEHTLRLQGNAAYAPFEQRLVLEADRTTTIEPQLVPLRTVLHLESGSGAEDARVELIRGDERREIRKLPADLELTPGAAYRVHASKKNFEDYDAEVSFEEGRPERSLVIALMPRERHGDATPPVSAPLRPLSPNAGTATPTGTGTLSINSIPISNILLDGRPMGSTPQRLNLSAGPHSLVFVHPTLGRQERSVTVTPGHTAVAAVRF